MTDEEIKRMARLFAEETSNGDALDPHIDFAEEYAIEVLRWLSGRYCIVPKSKVKELYDCYCQHEQTCKAKDLHNATLIAIGSQATMVDIFGKSLFEEEGK